MPSEITPAQTEVDENGIPFSTFYGDYYFSKNNGLEETRHVFLQGNRLPLRWAGQSCFSIAETGFGTGLNFLTSWHAWRADSGRCERLHYLSIEKHPLPGEQLATLLARWPELAPLTNRLVAQYPPVLAGFHRLSFEAGRLQLTLCFGDVHTMLDALGTPVDAWYLDGFAPARNPDMWSLPLMQQLARLSRAGTTFATFTAAGSVRRNLQQAGFQVEKQPGFGHKREMLVGRLETVGPAALLESSASGSPRASSPSALTLPWFRLPEPVITHRSAVVIGAGIAGCQVARALAERGWQLEILERHAEPASEASGNRAGIIAPKMTAEPGLGEHFYRSAFLFTLRLLRRLRADGHAFEWESCGTLQLNHNEREYQRWLKLQARQLPAEFLQLLSHDAASDRAGLPLPCGGSFFPDGGWLNPRSLCQALLEYPGIQLRQHQEAITLKRSTGGWQLFDAQQNLLTAAPLVVIANGRDAAHFTQTAPLPLVPVRGQSSLVTASPESRQLQVTLGHEGYFTPAIQGLHVFGASFERGQAHPQWQPHIDTRNVRQLQRYLPELAATLPAVQAGHTAIRMSTPDRFPCVGPLPDWQAFARDYALLRHGRHHQTFAPARYQPDLYLAAGFGSRGLTTSALCAELLACLINNEPLPLEKGLYYRLHPARFVIRQLQQGTLPR
ncbi:MAG TPA: bifunctional tRNA (5-methylaminomethyl-2-thiouridine)(34)-methyltransferase MnmD/FAD-dependent 5-carboxymethylaminomethyl-2-thiouridine(34) oxidoreductase MnmC [Thiolinea sp.]|nr:bifunctional tRNA (5-methylaminomethyl-2-thiouridine)(34)-methyltransferase MnmD/FAD-dependent 5-carboxymethylaminomethyl-2-thiouridine(34) oxidoreductase MnmC [Thiolinea sp.]